MHNAFITATYFLSLKRKHTYHNHFHHQNYTLTSGNQPHQLQEAQMALSFLSNLVNVNFEWITLVK